MIFDLLVVTAAWLVCLLLVVKSKKPEHRANGVQATRNTQTQR